MISTKASDVSLRFVPDNMLRLRDASWTKRVDVVAMGNQVVDLQGLPTSHGFQNNVTGLKVWCSQQGVASQSLKRLRLGAFELANLFT
jgi:hypothetical protein